VQTPVPLKKKKVYNTLISTEKAESGGAHLSFQLQWESQIGRLWLRLAPAKSKILSQKRTRENRAGGMAQVIECAKPRDQVSIHKKPKLNLKGFVLFCSLLV
jgi:hypothetical protein